MPDLTVNEALARSNLYGTLARFLRREVDAELLAELRRPEVAEALNEVGVSLEQVLATGAESDAALLEQLATGYTYLFLLTLNPHESVQRGEGQLWGQHTLAARAFMEEIGLAPAGEQSLLPDHIAIELEVMQHLTAEEAAALAARDSRRAAEVRALQKRYLQEHIGAWGVEFFGSAERLANHELYRQVAILARAFLFGEIAEAKQA